jgi:hypothetical protein
MLVAENATNILWFPPAKLVCYEKKFDVEGNVAGSYFSNILRLFAFCPI